MTTLPLIQDCVLIALDTVGFEVSGDAVLVGNLTDAVTSILVGASSTAYVLADEGITYDTSSGGVVEPLYSDRSAWDALNYQARHANDVDDPGGIHHTLGTSADQAAPGVHTHTEADLVLSDVTTNDSATAQHGFLPKLPGSASQYLGGDGTFHDIPTVLSCFLDNTASDIGGYKTLVTTVPAGGEVSASASITGAAVVVEEFALVANVFDFISTQVLHIHFHAEKTAGTKGVNAFARVYHRTSGGTETLIGTSDVTGAITAKTDFNVDAPVTDTIFSATDRFVVKFLGNQTGSGTDPTLAIYYQGTTASRVEAGTTPIAAATDANAIHVNVASEIHAITEKTTPADADEIVIEDSADSYNKKRVQLVNLPASSGVTRSGSTTDGNLAVWNGSDADSIKDGGPPGGGSGNVTFEAAFASAPGSPAEGDVWYITDGMLHARYTGAAWSYYYGTRKVVKPVLSDFSTWVNQGGATLDDYGHLALYVPAGAGGDGNNRGKVMTAPSLNYTIDALILPGVVPINNSGNYLCWSDGTKFVRFGIGNTQTAGGLELEVDKWAAATTYNSNYARLSIISNNALATPVWLRIQEDASNRTCSYSLDGGKHFHQVHQVGRTDYLTATQVGFLAYASNATYETTMTLLSWAQS